jgi:hypothetical protein
MSERPLHTQEVPRFKHDCERCTFLGPMDDVDVYACMQGGGLPTIILRSSDDPEDYQSAWERFGQLTPELKEAARAWLMEQDAVKRVVPFLEIAGGHMRFDRLVPHLEVGDRAGHVESGWSGEVTKIDGTQVTVRPDHPRPKEILSKSGGFIPTPEDWPGWKPITVELGELEKV